MTTHNLKNNKDFNFVNMDINVGNKDIMPLDTRIKSEYDNMESSSLLSSDNDTYTLSPSGEKDKSSSLSPSGLTRGSRSEMNPCFLDTRVKHEYDNSASSCHSGLRAGIQRDDNLMPKAFRFSQSGRSMVEMLGTLAIIGVLSIGGIAGYSYGMNKWRANVTINDINLRAIDLLSQLSQGHIPTLDAWDITGTAKYPILLNLDDAPTNYYIKVEQVPFEVCNMIADMMPEDVEILVDNDMQECAKGYNTLDFSYLGFGEQCGDSVCGTCQKCENESCVPITDYEQKCTSNGKFGWCIGGVCEPDTMCNCGENQYCADTNESACEPHPSGNCKDFNFRTVDIDGTTYYISNGYIASWWDNASACKALGKNMINHNEIAQACNQADDIECSTYGAKLTSLGKALYSEIGNSIVWSSIVNGCQASYVTLSDNPRIYGNPRANYHRFAVCR